MVEVKLYIYHRLAWLLDIHEAVIQLEAEAQNNCLVHILYLIIYKTVIYARQARYDACRIYMRQLFN